MSKSKRKSCPAAKHCFTVLDATDSGKVTSKCACQKAYPKKGKYQYEDVSKRCCKRSTGYGYGGKKRRDFQKEYDHLLELRKQSLIWDAEEGWKEQSQKEKARINYQIKKLKQTGRVK